MQILLPKWFTPDLQHPKTVASQNILVSFVCFAIQVAEKLSQSRRNIPTTGPSITHLLVSLTSANHNYIDNIVLNRS